MTTRVTRITDAEWEREMAVVSGEVTMNPLPDDLRAVLAEHGVEATVDGVLGWFRKRTRWMNLQMSTWTPGGELWEFECEGSFRKYPGSSPFQATARAFAAVVAKDEQ